MSRSSVDELVQDAALQAPGHLTIEELRRGATAALKRNPDARASDVILAGGLISRRAPAEERQPYAGRSIPESRLLSAWLRKRCEPSVRAVRMAVFGAPDPPFAGRTDATDWLKATSGSARASRTSAKVFEETMERLRAVLQEAVKATHQDWRATPTSRRLAYQPPGRGQIESVAVGTSSKLQTIYDVVQTLAVATGFAEDQITMWVLTGAAIQLPPVRVWIEHRSETLDDRTEVWRSRARIELNVAHIPEAELRALIFTARKGLKATNKKLLSEADEELLRSVRAAGGPPARPKQPGFWRTIARQTKSVSWEAAYKRWIRLQPRLAKRGILDVGTRPSGSVLIELAKIGKSSQTRGVKRGQTRGEPNKKPKKSTRGNKPG